MSWSGYITPEQNAALKVGDTLIRVVHLRPPEKVIIHSISPTRRITIAGLGINYQTYNVDGSRRGGSSWDRSHLEVPTEQSLSAVQRASDLSFLHRYGSKWESMSAGALRAIVQSIKQIESTFQQIESIKQ